MKWRNKDDIRFCGPAYGAAAHHLSAGSPACRRRSRCRLWRAADILFPGGVPGGAHVGGEVVGAFLWLFLSKTRK